MYLKTAFDQQRTNVRGVFEAEIRALLANVDTVVSKYLGGYGALLGKCGDLQGCARFAYSARPIDYALTIENVSVTIPPVDMAADQPAKEEIESLHDLVLGEIDAAVRVFNEMGDKVSNYFDPPFGLNGRIYDPGDPMPEAEIKALEDVFRKVLEDFRSRTKQLSIDTETSFSSYLRRAGNVDLDTLSDEFIASYLAGLAMEMNSNEVIAAYKSFGRDSDLTNARIDPLHFFADREAEVMHFVRAKCGTKYGEECVAEGKLATDAYPRSAYIYPYLVGDKPDYEKKPLNLFYRQTDNDVFTYSLSTGWYKAARPQRSFCGSIPNRPALDVGSQFT